jgi:hypothetical protein
MFTDGGLGVGLSLKVGEMVLVGVWVKLGVCDGVAVEVEVWVMLDVTVLVTV